MGIINYGDPEFGWYQGDRIDNQFTGHVSERYNGIVDVQDITDPFIDDTKRQPPNQPVLGEYQLIDRARFHTKNELHYTVDKTVEYAGDIPSTISNWTNASIGKTLLVTFDELHGGHQMLYKIIGMSAGGKIFYNSGMIVDDKWNVFSINWMNSDWRPDFPNIRELYPDIPFMTIYNYERIEQGMLHGEWEKKIDISRINKTTYIHNLIVDDLSVFNWTIKEWEDLHDTDRWKLDVVFDEDHKTFGFQLEFILDGEYDYDLLLYLNKKSENQIRNNQLIENAQMNVHVKEAGEVKVPSAALNVNTSRGVHIRKLFPLEYREPFHVTDEVATNGFIIDLGNYMHYNNEIHLEDIILYNKTLQQFEDLTDEESFRIAFQLSEKERTNEGSESWTIVQSAVINDPGEGYYSGEAWAWDPTNNIQIFGTIVVEDSTGKVLGFKHRHLLNPPKDGNYYLEIHQSDHISSGIGCKIFIQFRTVQVEVTDDGWVNHVTNEMAVPIGGKIKITPLHFIDNRTEYEVIISKTTRKWKFHKSTWEMLAPFQVDGYQSAKSRFYMLLNGKRFPLVNPSTKLPSFEINRNVDGFELKFMNLFRRGEQLEIRVLPYPIRSVYTLRKIPKHGYINLEGKLNKPVSKTYHEFWVNGKLLTNEVSIISPTKIFLHGLTSLRNLEIIEVNRDQEEIFSDEFVDVKLTGQKSKPYPVYNYETYLDKALKGTFDGDNYTLDEQDKLITPIWRQIARDHPQYKDYPENCNMDPDLLLRVYVPQDLPLPDDLELDYRYIIYDGPTLEGIPLSGRNMKWSNFGLQELSEETIINIINEIWANEIQTDPYFKPAIVTSESMWYGAVAQLYDVDGNRTDDIDDYAYKTYDKNLLLINHDKRRVDIIPDTTNATL